MKPQGNGRVACRVRIRAFTPNLEQAEQLFRGFELGAHTLDDGSLMISATLPSEYRWRRALSVHFDISTPKKYNLDIETNAGDLIIGDLDGEVVRVLLGIVERGVRHREVVSLRRHGPA